MWKLEKHTGKPVLQRRHGDVDVENRFVNPKEEERVGQIERVALTCIQSHV